MSEKSKQLQERLERDLRSAGLSHLLERVQRDYNVTQNPLDGLTLLEHLIWSAEFRGLDVQEFCEPVLDLAHVLAQAIQRHQRMAKERRR